MRVEFLYWDGCPSHPKALAELRETLTEMALDPGSVIVREVRSEEEASREGFIGSPTIRVDGVDIKPFGEEATGLVCRVYRLRDGRFSPTPDPADVREALRAAQTPTAGGIR